MPPKDANPLEAGALGVVVLMLDDPNIETRSSSGLLEVPASHMSRVRLALTLWRVVSIAGHA